MMSILWKTPNSAISFVLEPWHLLQMYYFFFLKVFRTSGLENQNEMHKHPKIYG